VTATHPHEARRFHAPALDGLRGLAFSIVFLSHVPGSSFVPGGFGVTIFFFLSGYLITTLLRIEMKDTGRISILGFYGRRALRILPPYVLVLGGVWLFTLLGGFPTKATSLAPLAWQAGFATNYWMVAHGTSLLPPGTEVFWSLAVEEHFYFVFPFAAIVLLRRVPARAQASWLAAACAVVLVWRVVLFTLLVPGDSARVMYASDTRIDSMLFGCILALRQNPVLDGPPRWLARGGWVLALSVAGLLLTIVARSAIFRETLRYSLQGILLIPVYTVILARSDLWVVRILNTPLLRWLGGLSYTLYLVHDSIIAMVRDHLGGARVLLISPIAFVLSILFSYGMQRLVERPLRARLRGAVSVRGKE